MIFVLSVCFLVLVLVCAIYSSWENPFQDTLRKMYKISKRHLGSPKEHLPFPDFIIIIIIS